MNSNFTLIFNCPLYTSPILTVCDNGWQKIAHVERIINIRCGTKHRRGEFGGGVGGMWAGIDKHIVGLGIGLL